MAILASELIKIIKIKTGHSIKRIEEESLLGKDSLKTASARGTNVSEDSLDKILAAYPFLNKKYFKLGEGSPYDELGTGVLQNSQGNNAKYIALLEEIAEERKQRNASIMDRLDRIEANQNKMLELITTNSSNVEAYRKSVEWNLRVTVKALAQIIPPDWKPGSAQSKQKLSKLVNAIQEDMIREDSEKEGN